MRLRLQVHQDGLYTFPADMWSLAVTYLQLFAGVPELNADVRQFIKSRSRTMEPSTHEAFPQLPETTAALLDEVGAPRMRCRAFDSGGCADGGVRGAGPASRM